MPFIARLLNVVAMPGEVFAAVKASRVSVANWLVPALLLGAASLLTAVVIVSQPSVQKQLREGLDQQANALAQRVKEGKIKQADADNSMAFTRALAQPPVLKVMLGAAAAMAGVARVFWWAFLLWLLGRRFLRVRFGFIKSLEVAGLGLMISVLGAVVILLLTLNVSKLFAEPGLALVASDFDAHRKSPLLLGVINAFSLWLVGVLTVGLSKLAGVPFLRAAWLVFATWIIQESFLALLGGMLGQFVF